MQRPEAQTRPPPTNSVHANACLAESYPKLKEQKKDRRRCLMSITNEAPPCCCRFPSGLARLVIWHGQATRYGPAVRSPLQQCTPSKAACRVSPRAIDNRILGNIHPVASGHGDICQRFPRHCPTSQWRIGGKGISTAPIPAPLAATTYPASTSVVSRVSRPGNSNRMTRRQDRHS